IDPATILGWLHACDEYHGEQCHSFDSPRSDIECNTDMIFMDAQQQCLVSVPSGHVKRYAALSYVWGNDLNPFMTLRDNFNQLRKPGAFSTNNQFPQLPDAVRDSTLISKLGLHLLWVDRTIVQDDQETKAEQLAAMAAIYTNAYFTIAATEGTAQSGLAGSSHDRPRRNPYRTFRFTSECHMMDRNPSVAEDAGDQGPYHTRGWTFQGWTLSRRVLIFHHQTISWRCRRLNRQENGTMPYDWVTPAYRWSIFHDMWSGIPNIESYIYHLGSYTQRDLTVPGDVLNAFQGILITLARSMRGHMLFGIPELFFSALLLWCPSD
ncbi:heterokaryon incompatibility protein-domain-containing protein, partial [Boeremia exigua]|uniref:heterokaryon incompatibility protein-domain-containing protein n=1 Tax=Boeremia exigua TaxID=749465 RepID=UPI001E8D9AE4